jgi:hypothetical protein
MRLYGDSEVCRLIYCRYFEANEKAFLNSFLRPGDLFVDRQLSPECLRNQYPNFNLIATKDPEFINTRLQI